MHTEITATEAARSFSDLLNRVRYSGESFLVLRNGEVMCKIEPALASKPATVGEFLDTIEDLPSCDADFVKDVEKVQKKQPKLPRSPWGS